MDRTDPQLRSDERTTLAEFLDYHRATLVGRIAGLDGDQMQARLPTSSLTLGGLVKHLAYVEDSWFQETFLGRPLPAPFRDVDWDADPDWEFHSAADDSPEELLALYAAACDRSRAVVAAAPDLDALSVEESRRPGEGRFSLRWILLHMIEETARHNGHADLLREAVDGVVGE